MGQAHRRASQDLSTSERPIEEPSGASSDQHETESTQISVSSEGKLKQSAGSSATEDAQAIRPIGRRRRERKSLQKINPLASLRMSNSTILVGSEAAPVVGSTSCCCCCCRAGGSSSPGDHSPSKLTLGASPSDCCYRCWLLAEELRPYEGKDYQALVQTDRPVDVPGRAALDLAPKRRDEKLQSTPPDSRLANTQAWPRPNQSGSGMPTRRRRHLIGSSKDRVKSQARPDFSVPTSTRLESKQLPRAAPDSRCSVSSASLLNIKWPVESVKLDEPELEFGKLLSGEQKSSNSAATRHKPDSCRPTPAPPSQEAPNAKSPSSDLARHETSTCSPATPASERGIKVGGRNESDMADGKQGDKTLMSVTQPYCQGATPADGKSLNSTDERSTSEQTQQEAREGKEQEPTQSDQPRLKSGGGGDDDDDDQKERRNQGEFTKEQLESRRPSHWAWNDLAQKYGKMPIRKAQMGQHGLAPFSSDHNHDNNHSQQELVRPDRSRRARFKDSCLFHVMTALILTVFPIFGSFRNYSLPGDLITDFTAGFTVAVLHIPQGMAYGLLSGVEPIYGLYVSFIPVLIMSFMSKSRHASYGTFAIISMLLVNTINQVRSTLSDEQAASLALSQATGNNSRPQLVIKNSHRPVDAIEQHKDQLVRQLLQQSSNSEISGDEPANQLQPTLNQGKNLLVDPTVLEGPAVVAAIATTNMPSNIEILSCVCIVCGIVHMTMSLMRLGVLSLMFSDQLVSSFTTAGAVHVLTSQLAGLFDLRLAPIGDEFFKCIRIWWQFTRALIYDDFNQPTAWLSLASILFLLAVKEVLEPRLRRRFKRLTCLPSELVLMSVVICCSRLYQFSSTYNIKIIGHVPTGLPKPQVPNLELVPYVLKDSISIALITFAMNFSIAQVYAKKFRYELNANQELFALGSANVISSFFSCFPCASSLSRSSVQSNLNVKSQLCSLFSCCVVVVIVCYFAHILHYLPKSTLSCIIVVALKGILMQMRDLYDNWRLSKLDALVWIFTFVSVIIFGVTLGLILGIVASMCMIFLRLLMPNHSVLGRLPGTDIYIDKDAFVDCEELEHVKIFRFNSALCYLNRTMLKSKIEKLLPTVFEPSGFRAICSQFHQQQATYNRANIDGSYGSTLETGKRTNFLVIDCSALSYCDYSGAATLLELVEDLAERKVAVYLAACPLKLIDMLEKMQARPDLLTHNVYPTISDAIGQIRYLQESADKKSKSGTLIASELTHSTPPDTRSGPSRSCKGDLVNNRNSRAMGVP